MGKPRQLGKWLFGLLFIGAGTLHFLLPAFYESIMPPYLRQWSLELVYISGVFEIVLGAMLLIPRFTVLAGWGLIALLIAVFPANLHMALNPEEYPNLSPVMLWLRLPLQGVLIACAWSFTRRVDSKKPCTSAGVP